MVIAIFFWEDLFTICGGQGKSRDMLQFLFVPIWWNVKHKNLLLVQFLPFFKVDFYYCFFLFSWDHKVKFFGVAYMAILESKPNLWNRGFVDLEVREREETTYLCPFQGQPKRGLIRMGPWPWSVFLPARWPFLIGKADNIWHPLLTSFLLTHEPISITPVLQHFIEWGSVNGSSGAVSRSTAATVTILATTPPRLDIMLHRLAFHIKLVSSLLLYY